MPNQPIYCDVLIAGAGSAGLAAAISARRKGASVVLLEKNSFIGGKATAAYVGTICGLYYRSQNPEARYVTDGFALEFAEKLKFKSGTEPIHNKHGLHYLPYAPLDFKVLCDEFIQQEKIDVYFHSIVSGVDKEHDTIKAVHAVVYDRSLTFYPSVVIDTTGEALLSDLSSASIIEAEEYQAPAQVFSMVGVNSILESNLGMILMKEIHKAIADGVLPEYYAGISIVPGSLKSQHVYIKIPIPKIIRNEVNKISSVEMKAREMIHTVVSFLSSTVEEFKNARLSDIAPEVGVRTGRRHEGKYILTKEDVLSGYKSERSAAKGVWPIEFWGIGKRVKMDFFEYDSYYDIPEDCLKSSRINNLFFAGRNISATEEAIASARVIGTCLQSGFHAGIMATTKLK